MFRQQAVGWVDIATDHLKKVEQIVQDFNGSLFVETIPDDRIRANVISHMEPMINSGMKAGETGLETILHDEREGNLLTLNKIFDSTLNAARLDRICARMVKAGVAANTYSQPANTVAGYAHLSLEDQAVYDIHDILKSFYKVSVERFTDNVVVQIIERYLLGSGGPVKCFSVEHVGGLTDAEVADIAGDDIRLRNLRTEITHRIQRLKQAMDIAKKVNSDHE